MSRRGFNRQPTSGEYFVTLTKSVKIESKMRLYGAFILTMLSINMAWLREAVYDQML